MEGSGASRAERRVRVRVRERERMGMGFERGEIMEKTSKRTSSVGVGSTIKGK